MRASTFGIGAVLIELGVDDHARRGEITRAVARALLDDDPTADVVVGAGAVLVSESRFGDGATLGVRDVAARALARTMAEGAQPRADATRHDIQVVYDGPDLGDLAEAANLTVPEIVERHAERTYVVEVVGFLPGFGYLAPLDPVLQRPRRATPRKRVAPSSVGVAGPFTGIYPFASPGGWHLLGRAVGPRLFDADREPPGRFRAGDEVRFVPVAAHQEPITPEAQTTDAPPSEPALEVLRAPPGATIQDGGRGGQLGRGLPPSGALDAVTLARANRAVGNSTGAAAIEVPLHRLVVRAHGSVSVSVDGEPPVTLASGDELEVAPTDRAVRYLAVAGGLDVPVVLGSRSTLLVAGMGGHEGRMLRKGDRLAVSVRGAAQPDTSATSSAGLDEDVDVPLDVDEPTLLHAVRTSSEDAFASDAWHRLAHETFRVSHAGNRVGVRLDGVIPRVGGDAGLPMPMVRGAIQVSTDGTPIVLGPDHAVTGGYPVIAVLTASAMARLARLRPGRPVRFEIVM